MNEPHSIRSAGRAALTTGLLALCAVVGAAALLWPPVIPMPVGGGAFLDVWRASWLHAARWPLLAACLALAAAAGAAVRMRNAPFSTPDTYHLPPNTFSPSRVFAPAAWLPLAAAVLFAADRLPSSWVATVVLLLPCLVVAQVVHRWYESLLPPVDEPVRSRCAALSDETGQRLGEARPTESVAVGRRSPNASPLPTRATGRECAAARRRDVAAILVVSTVAYTPLGVYTASRVGDVVGGDESAYIMMARSLYEDHDLDLRNNWEADQNGGRPMAHPRPFMHISAYARGDHWYSRHPFGFPLLLAPFQPLGRWGLYAAVALIAAAANAGLYACCRSIGAGRRITLLCVIALGTSVVWSFYATRAFAELLGAALLIGLLGSALAAGRRPWAACALASFAASALGWTQPRFLPLAALGGIAYGYAVLRSMRKEPGGVRSALSAIAPIAVFGGVTLAAYAALLAMLNRMFATEPVAGWAPWLRHTYGVLACMVIPYGLPFGTLGGWSANAGMWTALADRMGLIPVLPAFVLMAAAVVRGLWIRGVRAVSLFALVLFAVCLRVSCANVFAVGVGAVPGRYLVVVLPLLIPPLAWQLERSHPHARFAFLTLSSVSAALTLLTAIHLDRSQTHFGVPLQTLARVVPLLRHLPCPFANTLGADTGVAAILLSAGFIAAGAGFCALLLSSRPALARFHGPGAAAVIALGVAAAIAQPDRLGQDTYEGRLAAKCLRGLNPGPAGPVLRGASWADFDVTERGVFELTSGRVAGVTKRDLGTLQSKGGIVSQPRVEVNDWAGRGWRWATLVTPFTPPAGPLFVTLSGELDGAARVTMAVREGSATLAESELTVADGRVRAALPVDARGNRGHLYILLRLTADTTTTLRLNHLYWSPRIEP